MRGVNRISMEVTMAIVWTDIETTGLAPDECSILEVAAIVTTDDLTEVARFERVVYYEHAAHIVEGLARGGNPVPGDAYLAVAEELHVPVSVVVVAMHDINGLWKDCVHGQALDTVDRDFAAFIKEHGVREYHESDALGQPQLKWDRPQLAGSTISFDRGFLSRHMPRSSSLLHYRNIDVSTFNETARRFWPEVHEARPRSETKAHRGMADIEESIRVYKHYLSRLAPTPAPLEESTVNWDPRSHGIRTRLTRRAPQ